MSGLEGGGDFSAEFANVVLLILWAALPGLVLGYLRQARAVRRTRSEFTLCRSEAAELNRAAKGSNKTRERAARAGKP